MKFGPRCAPAFCMWLPLHYHNDDLYPYLYFFTSWQWGIRTWVGETRLEETNLGGANPERLE